jgi:hypothetical protein
MRNEIQANERDLARREATDHARVHVPATRLLRTGPLRTEGMIMSNLRTDSRITHYRDAETLVSQIDQWRLGSQILPGTTGQTPILVQLQAADVQLRLAAMHLALAGSDTAAALAAREDRRS